MLAVFDLNFFPSVIFLTTITEGRDVFPYCTTLETNFHGIFTNKKQQDLQSARCLLNFKQNTFVHTHATILFLLNWTLWFSERTLVLV